MNERLTLTDTQLRLTALWALAETALGGFLHAFKIPVTGFLVGGFAVLIIGLIAHHSTNKSSTILKATILVLLIKALVSPHSPPMAYIAVAFQGVMGALCFSYLPFRSAAIIFAVSAMLESSLQKLILTTLIFGMRFWDALDQAASDLAKSFQFSGAFSASMVIVSVFALIYFVWGLILGNWLSVLPAQLEKRKDWYTHIGLSSETLLPKQAGSNRMWWLLGIGITLGALVVYLGSQAGAFQRAIYAFIRSLFVVFLLYYVFRPILSLLINQWVSNKKNKYEPEMERVMGFLPNLTRSVKPLYNQVSAQFTGINRLKEFVLGLMVIALFRPDRKKRRIIVYSAPVRTGKTTRLMRWLNRQQNAHGFLTPDLDGSRKLYDLHSGEYSTFQISAESTEPHVVVGKYRFSKQAFLKAREMLAGFKDQKAGVFVIDEIGKLELQDSGLEPALSGCLRDFKQRTDGSTLVLIVRNTILQDVLSRYELQAEEIYEHAYFDAITYG